MPVLSGFSPQNHIPHSPTRGKLRIDQGGWATLEFRASGATLRIYDQAPDAHQRRCLIEYPLVFYDVLMDDKYFYRRFYGVQVINHKPL